VSAATSAGPLLLRGQVAAPPGPCDMTGMYVMHHAFRRDLARFAAAARHTPAPDTATWRAMRAHWRRFAHQLHEHHTKEDEAIWPLLLARVDAAGDTAGRRVLEAMAAEHDLIDPLLEDVEHELDALAAGIGAAEVRRDRLADVLDEARDVLGDHLAHEEREAIVLLQSLVTGEEWDHLERTALAGTPSPPVLLFLLPWVADGLTDAELDPLLSSGGRPVRLLLRLGTRRYERSRRRAFAHA
jgi:hemerythrin-like domain-containing protein